MTTPARIAFYAPIKPPDHPIASGDRQMARMLLGALRRAGYDAFLASRVIAYSKRPGLEHLEARRTAAGQEADRLLAEWRNGGAPDLWFSYHPYDKSPDWLGETVSKRLSIPFVTAEPCRTGADGDWLPWRAESKRIISGAAMNIVMTHADREYLAGFVPDERVTWLDPFVDEALLRSEPVADLWPRSSCRLLTVGMMRPGAKMQSYGVLAQALAALEGLDWSLAIVGDGPGDAEARAMFAPFADRVRFAGALPPEQVLSAMEQADLLAWPGCREAYGMAYLEAASRGLPSVALDNMGVPRVVSDGVSGLLARPPDADSYGALLRRAVGDAGLRSRLSRGALEFAQVRSGEYAAARLRQILDPILAAPA